MAFEPETMAGTRGWPGTPEGLGRPRPAPGPGEPEVPEEEPPELAPGDEVLCRCGRLVQAQMMTKVSALPQDVRGLRKRWVEDDRPGRGRGPKVVEEPAPDYLCDGCRETLVRTGKVSRADLVEALGAPQDVVDRFREQEAGGDSGTDGQGTGRGRAGGGGVGRHLPGAAGPGPA